MHKLHYGAMDSRWFKQRLKALDLTLDDVAAVLGRAAHTTALRILSGATGMKLEHVVPLARILKVPETEILYRAGLWEDPHQRIVAAPIFSGVEAGHFTDVVSDETDSDYDRPSLRIQYPRATLFALRVVGNSMDRIAPEGSHIVVDYRAKDLISGDLGVFRRGAESTFKRYQQIGSDRVLSPESTDARHGPIVIDDEDISVIGRVVSIQFPVRLDHSIADNPQSI